MWYHVAEPSEYSVNSLHIRNMIGHVVDSWQVIKDELPEIHRSHSPIYQLSLNLVY